MSTKMEEVKNIQLNWQP